MIISVNIQEQKEQFNFDNDVVIFVRHLANTKLITSAMGFLQHSFDGNYNVDIGHIP